MKAQQAADKLTVGVDYGGKGKTVLTGVLLSPTKDGKAFILSEGTIITKGAVEDLIKKYNKMYPRLNPKFNHQDPRDRESKGDIQC